MYQTYNVANIQCTTHTMHHTYNAPHEQCRAHGQGDGPLGVEGVVDPLPLKLIVGFWQPEPRVVVELYQLDPKE